MSTTQIASDPLQGAVSYLTEMLAPFEKTERIPAGRLLYSEGENPRGVYFLHEGKVDLVYSSRAGEAKALRVAEPGRILGLSCVVSRRAHDCSATARTDVVVGFIQREQLQKLLEEHTALWFTILQLISTDISACWDCMRTLTGVAAR